MLLQTQHSLDLDADQLPSYIVFSSGFSETLGFISPFLQSEVELQQTAD